MDSIHTNETMIHKGVGKRIGSIDALRAFALWGIVLVHSVALFGCGIQDSLQTPLDSWIKNSIISLFETRASCIFNILFGISFYIILNKKNYGERKFVWRCFLLLIIGLVAKFFYWPDALMWYGLCGMALVIIRKTSQLQLFIIIVTLYLLAFFVSFLSLGNYLTPLITDGFNVRYDEQASFSEAIILFPKGVLWYFRHIINAGLFKTFANFAIGYMIGRSGWIEKMDKKICLNHLLFAFLIYGVILILNHFYLQGWFEYWLKAAKRLSGAYFYSISLVWIYNNTKAHAFLHFFESYGKLGLTNYFMQGVVGVIVFCHLGVAFQHFRFTYIISAVILFYIIQALFSYYWLHFFKNGPMEYLWRCATELNWLSFRIK